MVREGGLDLRHGVSSHFGEPSDLDPGARREVTERGDAGVPKHRTGRMTDAGRRQAQLMLRRRTGCAGGRRGLAGFAGGDRFRRAVIGTLEKLEPRRRIEQERISVGHDEAAAVRMIDPQHHPGTRPDHVAGSHLVPCHGRWAGRRGGFAIDAGVAPDPLEPSGPTVGMSGCRGEASA